MNFFDMNSEVCNLRAEDEPSLGTFTQSLIEIAAAAEARGSDTSPTAALNAMRLPAIALDQHGFVADVNAAAETVFDKDVKIKDRRLFVRDPAARALLKEVIDQLRTSPRLNPLATDPIIVQRVENKAIYPDAATLQRLFAVANHDPAARTTIIREWARIKTGK